MDINAHKRTLGIVHIIYGCLGALVFVFAGFIISAFAPFISELIMEEEGMEGAMVFEIVANIIRTVIILAFIFASLPSILGGIGLLQNKSWGMVITLVAGCVSIFSFPAGTALGVYTLYVFIENNKKKNDENQG